MTVTQADLEEFQRYAAERLSNEGAESLSDLLREWEAARERQNTLDSIQRGLADVEAGRTRPAKEVLDELRAGLTSK